MRVELDLLRGPAQAGTVPSPGAGSPGAILFVAATTVSGADPPESQADWERALRTLIERSYAQQGIASVEYELDIL